MAQLRSVAFSFAGLFAAFLASACSDAAGGGGGAGGGTLAQAFVCGGSTPELALGQPTGFETCANGMLHRASVVTCPTALPRTTTCDGDYNNQCVNDAECTEHPGDFCAKHPSGIGSTYCACVRGCVTDADCGAGSICHCGDPTGTCVPSECTSDADCGAGLTCAIYNVQGGCLGNQYFACQAPTDSCAVDGDCGSSQECRFTGTRRECVTVQCTI